MLIALSIILIVLILIFCGDKGSKSIITTAGNAILLTITVYAIFRGINPIFAAMVMSVLSSCLILFFQNEKGIKSTISFFATLIVIVVIIPLVCILAFGSDSCGFTPAQYEITDSNGYSRNIDLNMLSVQIAVMIIALIGAAVDTAVAVTSSMYEIYESTPGITEKELKNSGFTVGRSILSTSMHTIFYIYIAEYMCLLMQYAADFSFPQMINSKSFAGSFLSITVCGTGCCLIVPVAVLLTSRALSKTKKERN